jgi:hypothetical protein
MVKHNGCDGCRRGLKVNTLGQHYLVKRRQAGALQGTGMDNAQGRLRLRMNSKFEYAEKFACTNKVRFRD